MWSHANGTYSDQENFSIGGMVTNCFDEVTNESLEFDIEIFNQDGSQTYESRNNTNPHVLNIGCNMGLYDHEMTKMGAKVTAIDFKMEQMEFYKKYVVENKKEEWTLFRTVEECLTGNLDNVNIKGGFHLKGWIVNSEEPKETKKGGAYYTRFTLLDKKGQTIKATLWRKDGTYLNNDWEIELNKCSVNEFQGERGILGFLQSVMPAEAKPPAIKKTAKKKIKTEVADEEMRKADWEAKDRMNAKMNANNFISPIVSAMIEQGIPKEEWRDNIEVAMDLTNDVYTGTLGVRTLEKVEEEEKLDK